MDNEEVGRVVNEVTITYSVRELLSRIEERLVRMETRAENVATKSDLQTITERIDTLESVRDKLIGGALAVGALAGGGVGYLVQLLNK